MKCCMTLLNFLSLPLRPKLVPETQISNAEAISTNIFFIYWWLGHGIIFAQEHQHNHLGRKLWYCYSNENWCTVLLTRDDSSTSWSLLTDNSCHFLMQTDPMWTGQKFCNPQITLCNLFHLFWIDLSFLVSSGQLKKPHKDRN